jgi:hypothetical protein
MVAKPGVDEGKLQFIKQVLAKNPNANDEVVNKAWKDAGREGTISKSYVSKLRSDLGLTKRRKRRRAAKAAVNGESAAPKRRGRPPGIKRGPGRPPGRRNGPVASVTVVSRLEAGGRRRELEALEAHLDESLFRAMGVGGLDEAVQLLRRARRVVTLAMP